MNRTLKGLDGQLSISDFRECERIIPQIKMYGYATTNRIITASFFQKHGYKVAVQGAGIMIVR